MASSSIYQGGVGVGVGVGGGCWGAQIPYSK